MANAVLDITPPSMEDIPPVLVDFERAQEPKNVNQAVADPILVEQDFNPHPPLQKRNRERLQEQNTGNCLKKQVTHLKKQLIKMKKSKW